MMVLKMGVLGCGWMEGHLPQQNSITAKMSPYKKNTPTSRQNSILGTVCAQCLEIAKKHVALEGNNLGESPRITRGWTGIPLSVAKEGSRGGGTVWL